MGHVWTHHAAVERLPERSGLTIEAIENRIAQRRYIIVRIRDGRYEEHHLIWDDVNECLIGVIVIRDRGENVIPTILPATTKSGYAIWRRAKAELAWRGKRKYYREYVGTYADKAIRVDVFLAKTWIKRSGWSDHRDILHLMSWQAHDPEAAISGDRGILALFRDRNFCLAVKELIKEWGVELPRLMKGDTPKIHIRTPSANHLIPLSFFLSTP